MPPPSLEGSSFLQFYKTIGGTPAVVFVTPDVEMQRIDVITELLLTVCFRSTTLRGRYSTSSMAMIPVSPAG